MSPRTGAGWQIAAILIAALVLLPVAALMGFALQGSIGLWPHLFRNVLANVSGAAGNSNLYFSVEDDYPCFWQVPEHSITNVNVT